MSRVKVKRLKAKRAKISHAEQLHDRIEVERGKLQRAAAVLLALVYSGDRGIETEQACDVAAVALDLVEQALAGLDRVALARGESSDPT